MVFSRRDSILPVFVFFVQSVPCNRRDATRKAVCPLPTNANLLPCELPFHEALDWRLIQNPSQARARLKLQRQAKMFVNAAFAYYS